MTPKQTTDAGPTPSRWRRAGRWVIPVALLAAALWLAAWMAQRAFNSQNRQRRLQSWLDENVNADVSLLSSMRMRLNLIRDSRLYLTGLEIEHPTPTFPGKFVTLDEVVVRAPSYSLYRLAAGALDLRFRRLGVEVEQNEAGEWSINGFMAPLSARNAEFPFPVPLLSGFRADFRQSTLSIRRRGFEMKFMLDEGVEATGSDGRLLVRASRLPFVFTRPGPEGPHSGFLVAETAALRIEFGTDGAVSLIPEACEFRVENLPCAALPFFFDGLPAEAMPGSLSGLIRISDDAETGPSARFEGEISDAPLSLFGLPPNAPVRMQLPLGGARPDRAATLRLGPSGYGGFDFRIPLDDRGAPKLLELRSDVVSLEDLARVIAAGAGWPGWLSAVLPAITWRSGKWLGYGWEGDNFSLNLSRSTAGMNISVEADLLSGKVRAAMNPGKERPTIVTIAAARIDAGQFAAKLSRLVPEPWRATLAGEYANLTWRGSLPDPAGSGHWNLNSVLARPRIDLTASGDWWRKLFDIPKAVANALPDWGGGDPKPLLAAAEAEKPALEQLSIVSIRDNDAGLRVEFVAQTGESGEIGGWVDLGDGSGMRGELFLSGSSPMLTAAEAANPRLAAVLRMLAGTPDGLRVVFSHEPETGLRFDYPFLLDAARIRDEMEKPPAP